VVGCGEDDLEGCRWVGRASVGTSFATLDSISPRPRQHTLSTTPSLLFWEATMRLGYRERNNSSGVRRYAALLEHLLAATPREILLRSSLLMTVGGTDAS
jgi:hypothetical protein